MASLIMLNTTIISRFLQFTHPFKIKWSSIKGLEKAEYFDYACIKAIFAAFMTLNVFLLFLYDNYYSLIPWVLVIWWWKWFTNRKFILCGILSVLSIAAYAVLGIKNIYYNVNIIWSAYTFYLAIWYKYYSFATVIEA
ncbi:MAG: hypothetical protein CL881_01725 [Dehalococcoidia bacterium]|jgi:hypothetical protein|nr:hypothetical protein [Dehalococcoidia bacterium]